MCGPHLVHWRKCGGLLHTFREAYYDALTIMGPGKKAEGAHLLLKSRKRHIRLALGRHVYQTDCFMEGTQMINARDRISQASHIGTFPRLLWYLRYN